MFLVLLLFGAPKLPGLAKSVGQSMKIFKSEIKSDKSDKADKDVDDVPITHVTNGVHIPTWLGKPIWQLLDRHLGEDWLDRATDPATWEAVDDIPAKEIWAVRTQQRAELIEYVRHRAVKDRLARDEPAPYAGGGVWPVPVTRSSIVVYGLQ